MRKESTLLVAALFVCFVTAGCGGASGDKVESAVDNSSDAVPEQSEVKGTESETETDAPKTAEFIEIDDYRFKLSPDIKDSGEAHLDFYVHDKDDNHVKGVTGTFHITKPDGSKETLAIEEEEPHDHYHGMTVLKDPGEYTVVSQVQIGDKKMNPRFSFKREAKSAQ